MSKVQRALSIVECRTERQLKLMAQVASANQKYCPWTLDCGLWTLDFDMRHRGTYRLLGATNEDQSWNYGLG